SSPPPPISTITSTTAATASRPTAPISPYIILLLLLDRPVGTITAGSLKPPPPNTGRPSIEPIAEEVAGFAAPAPPRYAFAIDRMSLRPDPAPPDAPVACPSHGGASHQAAGARAALASCARSVTGNSTQLPFPSPRRSAAAA